MNLRLYTASEKPLDALSKVKNQYETETDTFLNLAGHLLSQGTGSLTCAVLVLLHKGALHSHRRPHHLFSKPFSLRTLSFQEPLQFPRAVTLQFSSPGAFYFILSLAISSVASIQDAQIFIPRTLQKEKSFKNSTPTFKTPIHLKT